MRISVPGSNNPPAPRAALGFTLIELLVVLVIMGIALSMVTIRLLPDDVSRLRHAGEQLALLLENAGLQARSSGVPMAWVGKHSEYLFFERDEQGRWEPVETGPFRRRPLEEGITIASVELDGKHVKLGSRLPISATSFASPFNIKLRAGTSALYVAGDGIGSVTITQDKDAHAGANP